MRGAGGGRQGLSRFSIYAGLNEGGDIAHDAARVHALPLAEWMQVEDGTPWSFVRDDAVLQVTFRRDAARLDPAQPGAYFLSLTWMSVQEHFREMVDPDERARWRELVPGMLEQARRKRTEQEDELRKAGWQIDASYVDPTLPAEHH